MKRWVLVLSLIAAPAYAQNFKGDEALSKVLLDGEGWQPVAEGLGFADAAFGDTDGTVYFSDLRKRVVYKVEPDGRAAPWWTDAPAVSGWKRAADGRFVIATQGPKRQILVVDPKTRKTAVLAGGVAPNDLVVTRAGRVYFTDTAAGAVKSVALAPPGPVTTVATGLAGPNGIALSPDEATLFVSEARGAHAWAFRVDAAGALSPGLPWIDLRTPVDAHESGGDGATTDGEGRIYVTSRVGVQMFDWFGRLGGVIAPPSAAGVVSTAFGGDGRAFLYVCAGDRVWRRRTKVSGGR